MILKKVEAKELEVGQKFKLVTGSFTWCVFKVGQRWVVASTDMGKTKWLLRNDHLVRLVED